MRVVNTAVAAVAAVACAACLSAPPACFEPTCHGPNRVRVCAATPERAEEVAREVAAQVAAVRAVLPALDDGLVEVWLQRRPQVMWLSPFGEDVGAVMNRLTGRIHAADASPDLAADLAHEVVHRLLGDAWDGLPPTLEEGLCDQVATRIVADGTELRVDRLILAMAAVRGPPVRLRLDTPDGGWSAVGVRIIYDLSGDRFDLIDTYSRDRAQVRPYLTSDERAVWYGTAFVAAGRLLDRLGAEGLRQVCVAARDLDDDAAAALFAERAGLGTDPRPWHDAIEAAFGPAQRSALARRLGPRLVAGALDLVREQAREGTLAERFAAARPRLQVGAASNATLLLDVPELAELVPDEE